MAGYKELREGYEAVNTTAGTTGTRVFIEHTGGTDDLPALGDSFSITYPNSICDSITEVEYHFEDIDCKYKYTCAYTTSSSSSEHDTTNVPKTDPDNFISSGGSEMVSIESPKSWYWQKDKTKYNGRLYKNTVRGSMSKTLLLDDDQAYTDFRIAEIMPRLGKINNGILPVQLWYYPFAKGNVLFVSTNDKLVLDAEGERKWEVTMNFAYRILYVSPNNVLPAVQVDNSWNYYWNPKPESPGSPDWQLVGNKQVADVDTDLVYLTTDFGTIIIP